MKLLRFKEDKAIKFGKLQGDLVYELDKPGDDWCATGFKETGRSVDADGLQIIAPCSPTKIICLGLNYRSHAEEMNFPLPKVPIIFLKPSTAVIGPDTPIRYPQQIRRLDYEAELGVVMGRKAYRVPAEKALDYVIGYTCVNDVTARDKQPAKGQWTYAKSFDTFCPLGPVIETEIDDPENLSIEGLLNGKIVQSSSTAQHIFSVAEIIAFVSGCMTLLPGDVIMTGTSAGIGPMEIGDSFTVRIEKIGSLTNKVINGS